MARFPRVVVVDVPHHVTQRGNARQAILADDSDRLAYLELLRKYCAIYHLSLLGYCLMPNHVHLIAIPGSVEGLAQTLKHTHGRYASYWNARQSSSGHVWQGRFYSCPLDDSHLWEALRYVELNPVRAGMVSVAEQWRWSSASAHCIAGGSDRLLEMGRWQNRWTVAEWREYLGAAVEQDDVRALRQCTHTGRPLGSAEFVAALEQATLRPLAARKGGRPKKPVGDHGQNELTFIA
ncbi:MAG: transposase [Terriglobales bacterium]|jgi:putative transposase